jgi:moderate conductance mechanosensitive channel
MFREVGSSSDWSIVVLALGAALGVAYALAAIMARLSRASLLYLFDGDRASEAANLVAQRPTRIVRAVVFVLVMAVLVRPTLNLVGLRPTIGVESRALMAWLFDSGLRIVLVAIVTYLLVKVIGALTGRFEEALRHQTVAGIDAIEHLKRARTLGALVQRVLTIVVVSIGALMILRELRVDITPILTGAGIVGLAVGFGAQTLVRDIISGFFVILENQVRVGDAAVINGVNGLVEAVNLRTIVLRDGEGVVHIFPNGAVTTLANRTKDYSYAVVDVGIAYREDPDAVIMLLKDIGATLEADSAFRDSVLEPVEVIGIEALGDAQVTIRTRIKTVPLRQWDVARDFRRRIKIAFDQRGIRFRDPVMLAEFAPVKPPPAS